MKSLCYSWQNPSCSLHRSFQLAISCEQGPEILELPCLGKTLISDPEVSTPPFSDWESWPLIWRGWLSCWPLHTHLRSRSWLQEANRTTSSTKSRYASLRLPHQRLSSPQLLLKILSMKITNRIGDEGQPLFHILGENHTALPESQIQ